MSEEEKKQCECDGNCKEATIKEKEAYTEDDIVKTVGYLDIILAKLISRKLTVLIIATVFICLGKLPPDQWSIIAATYIGSQAMLEIVGKIKGE